MNIKCLTYNVKGFNSPNKRHKVLRELQHYGADVFFLQETHLVWEAGIKLYSKYFPKWIYSDSPIKRLCKRIKFCPNRQENRPGRALSFSKDQNW